MKARQFIDEMAEFLYPGEDNTVAPHRPATVRVCVSVRGKLSDLSYARSQEIEQHPLVLVAETAVGTSTGIRKKFQVTEPVSPWLETLIRKTAEHWPMKIRERKLKNLYKTVKVNELFDQLKAKVVTLSNQWIEDYKRRHPVSQLRKIKFEQVIDLSDFDDNFEWEKVINELDATGFRYFVKTYEFNKSMSFVMDIYKPGDVIYKLERYNDDILILISPGEREEFNRFVTKLQRLKANQAIGD